MVKLRLRDQARGLAELIEEIVDKRDPAEIHIADTDSRRDRPIAVSEVDRSGKIERMTYIGLDGEREQTFP